MTKDDGLKDNADPTPLIATFDSRIGAPSIKQLVVKEVQYRKTAIEQMGMAKIEHVIEIQHGKKSARFVYSHGMVALESLQAKRIKHSSNTEKTEALHRSIVNAGKFTIVKYSDSQFPMKRISLAARPVPFRRSIEML